ncbi:site-specific integrase [Sphaerimonospora sp. CA-214678]|uniref:site-specific integrase n=1 Tax=Sphaerimonospora sp. CA-214678 TaxID=3240029 RepID=UPI003D8C938C
MGGTIRGLLPAIRAGLVQVWALDPKRIELSFGRELFDSRYAADPAECADLLDEAVSVMQERADRFAGLQRSHTPTIDDPFILTVSQVFELADKMADRRFRALILLTTFASLRWGEAIALRRSDIDIEARTVRVREQLIELDGGEMVLAPPKLRAGKRTVSIPSAIVPALTAHLIEFVGPAEDAFVFLGKRGAFLRGGNFRREAKWAEALKEMGLAGLHFHDLRHTGNTLAAQSGASLADLKARMGHDSDRAALIYQHATRDADQRIADALSARVQAEQRKAKNTKKRKKDKNDDDDGNAGALVPVS